VKLDLVMKMGIRKFIRNLYCYFEEQEIKSHVFSMTVPQRRNEITADISRF